MSKILIYTFAVMVAILFFMPLLTSIVKIALFAAVVVAGYWAIKRYFGESE